VFFKGSRYEKVPNRTIVDASGRIIPYKGIRVIPDASSFIGHRVADHERLDHIAWQHYRDPELFWRICDANLAIWPDDLLETGAILNIPAQET
jgi:hypothetical protein